MRDHRLVDLERDVEVTRARLARNLSALRSPSTLTEFSETVKQEALGTKDALLEQAKSSAMSSALSVVDDIKARAAANPVGALLIGAGIAWRLFKHPPVATALVGAGLFSLLRAQPGTRKGLTDEEYWNEAKGNLQDRARDLAATASDKAGELAAIAQDKASAMASAAQERVGELAAKAGHAANRTLHDARDKIHDAGSTLSSEVNRMSADAADKAAHAADRLYSQSRETAEKARTTIGNSADAVSDRDKLLLGVAGLAVAAAVGYAYQHRDQGDDGR